MIFLLQPNIRYTDTSYIIAQQWKKGREKTTFPNVYAYEYNRQKFVNLAKCDERATLSPRLSSMRMPKRPKPVSLPVLPPPLPPPPPPKRSEQCEEEKPLEEHGTISSDGRKRKGKSIDDIELSDLDDDIGNKSLQPIITVDEAPDCFDEPDASQSISNPITVTEIPLSSSTSDEAAAICMDNSLTCNDATADDKSQMSYDEILQIDESLRDGDDGSDIETNPFNECIIVEVHDVPAIELKIHESDSDESAFGTIKTTKESAITKTIDVDRERCHSEDDANDSHGEEKEERLVQSDSEILTKTPIELVVKCDINENVFVSNANIDWDHNHNDIVKSVDRDVGAVYSDEEKIHPDLVKKHSDPKIMRSDLNKKHLQLEMHSDGENVHSDGERVSELSVSSRVSISSRSSCYESDAEPMYATVGDENNMVSVLLKRYFTEGAIMMKNRTFGGGS